LATIQNNNLLKSLNNIKHYLNAI